MLQRAGVLLMQFSVPSLWFCSSLVFSIAVNRLGALSALGVWSHVFRLQILHQNAKSCRDGKRNPRSSPCGRGKVIQFGALRMRQGEQRQQGQLKDKIHTAGAEQTRTQTKSLQSLTTGWKTPELNESGEKKMQELKGEGRRMANKKQCP